MNKRVKVLVVDDSAFARKVMREVLSREPSIEVVGIARDGLEALEKIAELRPDVVTLDLVMPDLDGIGLLRSLPPNPPRVVVVSMSDAESEIAIEALASGAFDLVHKPTALATDRLYELAGELTSKVLAAAGAPAPRAYGPVAVVDPIPHARAEVVVLGTSTGGPQALTRLVTALPKGFPVPVVIVIHIPPGYTEALAQRLDRASQITVVEASEGLELGPSMAVVARAGIHLKLRRSGTRIVTRLEAAPLGLLHMPSVDVLFESAAEQIGAGVVGVVLTGMGEDGLIGAGRIRARGGSILTESPLSSVVDGMPRAVREAALSNAEAPIDEMAKLIAQWVERGT